MGFKINYFLLLSLSLVIISLSGIGIDLYVPSMPAIAEHFHAPITWVKFTIPMFLVGFALGQIIFGTLSDIYGRKKILILGLILFMITSFAAVFAQNIYWLLFYRAIQGLGTASASAISKAILTDSLTGKKLAHAFIYTALVWTLGPVIAPVIGGYLQYYFNWQANFYFYGIYSLLVLLVVSLFLKETNLKLMHAHPKKILDNFKKILTHRRFVGGVIVLGFGYAIFLVFSILGPFIIQNDLGYSAIVFGHLAFLVGIAYFGGITVNRVLIQFFTPKKLIPLGLVLMILTSFLQLILSKFLPLTITTFILPILIIVAADGLVYPNCMVECLSYFPEIGGTASAAMGCLLTLFSSSATFVVSYIHPATLTPVAWIFIILLALQILTYWLLLSREDASPF